MTVSSTTNRKEYAGNGATTSFATTPFVFFVEGDLDVYVVNDTTGIATLKTITTDYTVTGGAGSTGTVVMVTAPATGETLVIVRDLAITQESNFVNNDASDAEVAEDALDRLTMVAQQLDARLDRSLSLADSDTSGVAVTVPTPAANSIFGWNAAGTALINYVIQAGTSLVDLAASTGATLIGAIQAGTGAVLRTLQQILWDRVSALDFIPVSLHASIRAGTSTTDLTTYVQAALTAHAAVFFPPGTYTLGQVALKNSQHIYGVGPASNLKLKASGNNYLLANTNGAVYVDDVHIHDIAIDGNKANNTSGGGIVGNGRRWTIENCYIHDCANAAVNMGVGSAGATDTPLAGHHKIINNTFLNSSNSAGNWGAAALTHGSNVIFAGNTIECTDGFMTYGIDVEPNTGNTIDNVLIAGNTIKGGRIFADCGNLGSPGTNISIIGNKVDARGSYGETVVNIAPVYVRNVTGFTCTGNDLVGHVDGVRGGIHIQSGLTNFKITDNLITTYQPAAGAGYGIHFNNTANCGVSGKVENNHIIAAEATSYGIYCIHSSGLSGVRIANNHFSGTFTASILVQGTNAAGPTSLPNVSADIGDAAYTISHLKESTTYLNTPLTAARTVALSRSVDDPMTPVGQIYHFIRTAAATGDFAWNIGSGPTAVLYQGQSCAVQCVGSTFVLLGKWSLVADTPVSPAQITSNQDNYNPDAVATFWRLSSDASHNITGIGKPFSGRRLVIVNVGAQSIVLQNQNAGSDTVNRIITGTGADVTLAADDTANLIYDSTTARWRITNTY